MGVGGFQVPAARQLLVEGGEGRFVAQRPGTPGRGHVGRTTETGLAAFGIPVGHGAPRGALNLFVLIVITDGQHGGVGQVGFEDAVADLALQRVLVTKRLAVAIGQHRAPTQAAIERQRAADIDVAVVVVVTAAADTRQRLQLRGRTFAHHVDRRRWVARARGEAGRTAHHLDPVVDDGVGIGLHVAEGVEHPVDLEVVDRVTARRIADPVRIVVLHDDAGGLAHGLGQCTEFEIVHLLTRDHGHRLRGFLDRQVHPRRGAHCAGRVGIGVLGVDPQAFGADAGGVQFQRFGGRLWRCFGVGFSQQIGTQHCAAQAESEGDGTGNGREHRSRLLVFERKNPLVQRRGAARRFSNKREILLFVDVSPNRRSS